MFQIWVETYFNPSVKIQTTREAREIEIRFSALPVRIVRLLPSTTTDPF